MALIYILFNDASNRHHPVVAPQHSQASKWAWMPPLRSRNQLAELLQTEGKKVGMPGDHVIMYTATDNSRISAGQ